MLWLVQLQHTLTQPCMCIAAQKIPTFLHIPACTHTCTSTRLSFTAVTFIWIIFPSREQKTLLSKLCPWADNSVWFAPFWTLAFWDALGKKKYWNHVDQQTYFISSWCHFTVMCLAGLNKRQIAGLKNVWNKTVTNNLKDFGEDYRRRHFILGYLQAIDTLTLHYRH